MNYFNPCPRCEEKREKEHAVLVEIIANGYGKMSQDDYNENMARLGKACVKSYSLKEKIESYVISGKLTYTYGCFCSVCHYEVVKNGTVSLL